MTEFKEGRVSAATPDVRARGITITDAELRERMSGNICRCGAYPNIVAAVRAAIAEQTGSLPAPVGDDAPGAGA